MKKNLITLLVVALVAVGLFAADPPATTFDVSTTIAGVSNLKLGATTTAVPTTVAGFNTDVTADTSSFGVTDANYASANTVRSIFAYSNNRTGYTISLAAKAMKGAASGTYINFTVEAGGASVLTENNDTYKSATNPVKQETFLSGLSFSKTDIEITVTATDYVNAVTDTYTGTIQVSMTSP